MLKPNKRIATCQGRTDRQYVPNVFHLLNWNIYKANFKVPEAFQNTLKTFEKKMPFDFCCFQEAHFDEDENMAFQLDGFASYFAANLQLKHYAYGVLTASSIQSHEAYQVLSRKTEFLFKTHKTSLITRYHFADGTPLIIANMHAINFKRTFFYDKEIQLLAQVLKDYPLDYPMIVTGDFNTWSRHRHKIIRDFCRTLKLRLFPFQQAHLIKTFANHPLDLVMYRGLTPAKGYAYDQQNVSDHNPLFASFART